MSLIIGSGKSIQSVSALFFLLLFPGFYFYQQATAAGVMPRFLGGFFSFICLAALICLLPFYRLWLNSLARSLYYSYLFLFLLIWTLASAVLTSWLYPHEYISDAIYQYMNTLLTWVALFMVGAGLSLNLNWFKMLLWISGGLIFTMLLHYVVTTGNPQYYVARLYDFEGDIASYQGFARSALLVAFALCALSRTVKMQAAVAISSVFVLFVLAARSEFAIIIICLSLLFIIRFRRQKAQLLVVFLVGGVLLITTNAFHQKIFETRQARILDLSSDTSWSLRQKYMDEAWLRINEAPLFGQFGGHFESGGSGSYAHNIIAAWDSFGIVGFILFLLLALIPAIDATKSVLRSKIWDSDLVLYFLISVSTFILILVSKTYLWPMPALSWGLYIGRKRLRGYDERRSVCSSSH